MANFLIGVDIGTQGTKSVLFDSDLNPVASSFVESNLISPQPGTIWQEPDELFSSVLQGVKQVMDQSGISPKEVAALGIDSQMAGIMGVDETGEASMIYDSWLDTRCAPYAEQMAATAGESITRITGGPVTYTHGPKILWWKEHYPQVYQRTCKFVLPHGYVVGKLCGLKGKDFVFDYTCLQYSGFGDNQNLVWSQELLDQFHVDAEKMARIVSPFEILGGIVPAWADQMGLLPGTPVVAGGGDTSCSIFGSGLFKPGTLLDCAGTASVLCCAVDRYVPDTANQTMNMMRSPLEGLWYPLAYINGGGMDVSWFRKEFTGQPPMSYQELEAQAEQLPCGSEGLIFAPHFNGRVLPSDPRMKGAFVGLDWKHTPAHLFRAVMEGVGYEYAYYLQILRQLYPEAPFQEMTAIGGGAKSPLFLQLKADILGVNVIPLQVGDTAPVGSAVIAGTGVGLFQDPREPVTKTIQRRQAVSSNPEHHKAYKPYKEAYLQTLAALSALYREQPLWNASPLE